MIVIPILTSDKRGGTVERISHHEKLNTKSSDTRGRAWYSRTSVYQGDPERDAANY